MAKQPKTHIVFPLLPAEVKKMGLTAVPEDVEVAGLIFTRYETEQALLRWQHRKHQNPLKHPSRSAFIQQCLDTQAQTDVAIRRIRLAYDKVQDDIEVAKTDILCKITEKSELEQGIQHEIALRKNAEREKRVAEDLIEAQKRKIDTAEHQSELLRKTIERYEIRYQTLRNEYPLNWIQRFVGWIFRIC